MLSMIVSEIEKKIVVLGCVVHGKIAAVQVAGYEMLSQYAMCECGMMVQCSWVPPINGSSLERRE